MDTLLSFLNTLLGIEVTVFGIISAVILVFVQLVYTNYSYKHIGHILKNALLIWFFIFSAIDLIITSAASYYLAFSGKIFSPTISLVIGPIVTNQYYVFACWFLIFVSISFFIILLKNNITYLQPHRAIFLLAKSISYDAFRKYLWQSYELRPPYTLRIRRDGVTTKEDFEDFDENSEMEQLLEDKDGIELAEINKQIRKIKKQTANAEDPLLPVRDMMIQFIRRADLSSLTEAQGLLRTVSTDFLNNVPKQKAREWSPHDGLLLSFTRHQIELLSTLLEIAEKEGLESAQTILLRFGYAFALSLIEKGGYQEFDIIQKFFQKIADRSIGKSAAIFQEIIDFYQTAGERVFDLLKEKPAPEFDRSQCLGILDQIFRSLGWLGERLLTKLPPEESPLMMNSEYGTEYDALLNCVLTFSRRYNHEQPASYPLIYFDCVDVIHRKLSPICAKTKIQSLSGNLFDLAYTLESFAEAALTASNSRGASLAAMRIRDAYETLKKVGLDKEANDVISLLAKIGITAAVKAGELEHVEFMPEGLDRWVADRLVASEENVDSAVFKCYIDMMGANHDAVWKFIKYLGVRIGSNFGLMFDTKTGEDYLPDDPHRQ